MSISTILGNGRAPSPLTLVRDGAPALSPLGGSPWGVVVYNKEIYFSVEEQGYIGRLRNGQIEILVSGLKGPMSFDIDDVGTLYIPEYGADQITIVDQAGTRRTALRGVVKNPMSLCYRNGIYYVVDTGHHRILEWDPETDEYDVIVGTGRPGYRAGAHDALESQLFFPIDMDVNEEDELVIADGMNNLLRFVDGYRIMTTIVGVGGNRCLEADDALSPCSNMFLGDGPALEISLNWPFAPRFDRAGNIWFIDANNNLLRRLNIDTGDVETIAGQRGLPDPQPQNEYYMRHKTESYGKDIGDGSDFSQVIFYRPMGMTLLEYADGTVSVIIADTDNQRIRLINGAAFL